MYHNRFIFILSLLILISVNTYSNNKIRQWDVYSYGAKGDGKTSDTKSIQAAIDDCHNAGGGVVRLENGRFCTGTIILKSNVRLHIESGVVLLGSPLAKDYIDLKLKDPTLKEKYNGGRSLIYSEGQTNISVTGNGIIDGNGEILFNGKEIRTHIIHFNKCSNIKVKDVKLTNGSWWIQKYNLCNDVQIDGVIVDSNENRDLNTPRYATGPGRNTDGCNIVDCRNVQISNCNIVSGDDGIVLKSFSKEKGCHNITINNCLVSTNASGIKMGTESAGAFQDITVNNCVVYNTRLGGIELLVVDGAKMERVIVSNISLNDVQGSAIYVRLGNRAREYEESRNPSFGSLKDILIKNIYGSNLGNYGSSITGIPGAALENITLDNINLTLRGGSGPVYFENAPHKPVKELTIDNVPELEDGYPRCDVFGKLPAFGFYIRHAKGVELRNIKLAFQDDDLRSAIVADDVSNLFINNLQAQGTSKTPSLVQLRNVRTGILSDCIVLEDNPVFLHLSGNQTKDIRVKSNVLKKSIQKIKAESPELMSQVEFE